MDIVSNQNESLLGVVTYVLKYGNLLDMGLVIFGSEKYSSEYINMGSSFENFDATSPTMKTDHKSHKQFELQNI